MRNGSAPSSVGSIGEPYFDYRNSRVKGFYPDVVREASDIEEYIAQSRSLREQTGATRTTLRFLVPADIELLKAFPDRTEAVLELSGPWSDHYLVYWGENSPDRMAPQEVLDVEDDIVDWAEISRRVDDPIERAARSGQKIEILESPFGGIPQDTEYLFDIYSRSFSRYMFELSRENIARMVSNPANITVVARGHCSGISSVVMGETMAVPTSRGEFRFCEYSDEATFPTQRGLGLGQACLKLLSQTVLQRGVHTVYGEARACSRGVNKVPSSTGFSYAGRLHKHCIIGGPADVAEEGPYENLNVWYTKV